MKVVGDFNNVSKELRPKLPPKGTIVKYQFLIGNPDPEHPNNRDKDNYPPSYRIKTFDRIYDGAKNEFVDIGVYDKLVKDKDGNQTIRTKAKYLRGGKAVNGVYLLTIGTIEDDEMFEFLELSNQNSSNPNRDTSVIPMFSRIDEARDAKERKKVVSRLTSALTFVESMSDADKREFAAAMAWNETVDIEMLDDQISQYALKSPEAFLDFINDPHIKDKALLKYAETKGIIKHDPTTNKILWGDTGNTIANLERQDGKSYVDNFHDWIRTKKNGDDIMGSIRKRTNNLIKDNSKPKPEPVE